MGTRPALHLLSVGQVVRRGRTELGGQEKWQVAIGLAALAPGTPPTRRTGRRAREGLAAPPCRSFRMRCSLTPTPALAQRRLAPARPSLLYRSISRATPAPSTSALSASLSVAGNWTFASGMTVAVSSGTGVTFTASATITSAGKGFPAVAVNGAGITVTPADKLTCSSTLTLTQGTFDAGANNVDVEASNFSSSNSNVRTVNLGTGLWTLTGSGQTTLWSCGTATNLTVNASTSTIKFTNGSNSQTITFAGGAKTYNKLWLAGTGQTCIYNVTGANTFADLTIEVGANCGITLAANQTISAVNSTGGYRLSSDSNTARTVTTAAALSLSNAYVSKITKAGAGSIAVSGGVDGGANTGISFSAAANGNVMLVNSDALVA